ncbi:MAG: DUF5777 family beta-barrel protein [Cytophagales bacterium]|nr:DUF5777 family beta-barrel protein [Cytophagales bacterium]
MKRLTYFLFALFIFLAVAARAQEEDEKPRPQRKAFESAVLIDNQSDVVNTAKTLEWNIQHRFGTVENGSKDLWGVFAASNIRLGFTYTPIEKLAVGFGLSKIGNRTGTNPFIDLDVKYKILTQTRENEMPVNLTFYGNMGIDTRDKSKFDERAHRLSYFGQFILSRRISKRFSIQGTAMMSHFNAVDTLFSNDIFGIGLGARYKVSSQGSILLEWTEPLNKHDINSTSHGDLMRRAGPYRNIAIAYEIATSAHAFQITFGIYRDLVQQYNLAYNSTYTAQDLFNANGNDWYKFQYAVGFNMTRLWGF